MPMASKVSRVSRNAVLSPFIRKFSLLCRCQSRSDDSRNLIQDVEATSFLTFRRQNVFKCARQGKEFAGCSLPSSRVDPFLFPTRPIPHRVNFVPDDCFPPFPRRTSSNDNFRCLAG